MVREGSDCPIQPPDCPYHSESVKSNVHHEGLTGLSALDPTDSSQLSVLAEEIRHFRKKNNFSLEQLAEASGVSRSMISKIERCETVPSTVILSKLAEALGVTFSQLMAPAVEREIVHIPAARQPILRDEESGFLRRCISPVLPGRGIDWVLNTLPPEAETGNFVAHRRGVEEYIFVLRGRMRVSIGDQRVNLSQGDSLYFQADADHSFLNLGKTPCEYFLVIDTAKVRS
ncbi:helix-turn-helix domain-containing protein [Bradyrhizobium cenepequi]